MSELVSVLIPAYNAEKTILEALESAVSQDYRPLEIVIVNDCSTDNTEEVVFDWMDNRQDKEVEVVYSTNVKNSGSAKTRNECLKLSTGGFLQLLDADDVLLPSKISKSVAEMQKDDKVGIVYSHYKSLTDDGISEEIGRNEYSIEQTMNECVVTTASLIRRKYLEAVHGWDESYKLVEDYALSAKMALICDAVCIKEPLFLYRQQGQNKTKKDVTTTELWHKEHIRIKTGLAKKIGEHRQEKLVNAMCGGIGDLVAISSTYKRFKEFYPDSEIVHYCYDSPFKDIIEYNPYIDQIIAGGNLIDMLNQAKRDFPNHRIITTDYFYRYGYDYWKTPLNLVQFFSQDIMGVHFDLDMHNPEFYFNPDGSDFKAPDKASKKYGRYVVVEAQTRTDKGRKNMSDNNWDIVMDFLDALDVKVVTVGAKDVPCFGGYKNVFNERDFTIRETARFIQNSSMCITQQSGISWISQALNKQGVMINIGSPVSYCGRWGDNVLVVEQKEVFNPDSINIDEVLHAIEEALERWY